MWKYGLVETVIFRSGEQMGKITAIVSHKKNKNFCDVFIDGEFKATLALEIVLKSRLKIGMDISGVELEETVSRSENVAALNKATSYITKAFKTKKQVIEYLRGKGFSERAVFFAVDKLKEYGYIDDVEYAKKYFVSASMQGKRLSEYKLMTKGVSIKDIEKAFEQTSLNMDEKALSLAEKYIRKKDKTGENFAKTFRYLISKGFSFDEAENAVAALKEGNDGEDSFR